MGWISALTVIGSIAVLRVQLGRAVPEQGWRGQVEGLRKRLERRDSLV
jgi:hypothetical protein